MQSLSLSLSLNVQYEMIDYIETIYIFHIRIELPSRKQLFSVHSQFHYANHLELSSFLAFCKWEEFCQVSTILRFWPLLSIPFTFTENFFLACASYVFIYD